MEEPNVGGVQLRQEIAHCSLEFVCCRSVFDIRLVALNGSVPIPIQFFGRIESFPQSGKDVFENGAPVFGYELDRHGWSCHCIRGH
jgi:hypothetical protein